MQLIKKLFRNTLTIAFLILTIAAINAAAATFTVTNTNDSGAGSLRDAITQANTNAQADTINFDAAFFATARTITLASELQITADGANPGRLVTINGPGASLLTVSGGNAVRLFYLPPNSNVSMSGMTLRDGNGNGSEPFYNGSGGAIACVGNFLTLTNMVFRNNTVVNDGGGLYTNDARSLSIFNSVFRENVVSATNHSGGGMFLGGGNGTITISDTLVTENRAGYGGGIWETGTLVKTVRNTTISNNTARNQVGGASFTHGTMTMTNCQITGNKALPAPNSGFPAGGASQIGGLSLFFGAATFTDTVISNNTTGLPPSAGYPDGVIGIIGGVNIDRTNTVFRRVTVDGNTDYAQQTAGGAGMHLRAGGESPITIIDSIISNNRHFDVPGGNTLADSPGGGIFATGGSVSVINTTITGNFALVGGGIFNLANGLKIINSTIAGNTAVLGNPNEPERGGGGIYNRNDSFATVTIQNSIIANNSSPTGPDVKGGIISNGYNLIGNTADSTGFGAAGDQLNVNPLLGALQNNGGTTLTFALQAGSPAINAGNNALAVDQNGNLNPFDQRGRCYERFVGGTVDIGAFESGANAACNPSRFDFDGDGRDDVSVFRPSNGVWYLQQSTAGFTGVAFGQNGDLITPADFDGDGKTDIAVFRPSNGVWYLQRSQLGFTGVAFGQAGDVPMPADYDGDGKADIAVFRPSNGTWYLQRSTAGFTGIAFGSNGDVPVAGDYDGDGKADIAVFRPSNGTWYLQQSTAGFTGFTFGTAGDKPVPADYDGDGKTDIAVFRPSNGTWYLQRSTAGFTGVAFGLNTDLPAPADYDGDGRADVAVFRNGTWYLQRSTQGFTGVAFGTTNDLPVPNAFVY